jgi:FAD/FMN-containing dehydrogenase
VTFPETSQQQLSAERARLHTAVNSLALPQHSGVAEHWCGDQTAAAVQAPLSIVQPRSSDDVMAAVQWARQQRVPLTTFSSGAGPHARGLTASEPTVVLDLSVLRRIIEVDECDAMAIIEPGVTHAMLDARLAPLGLRSYRPLMPRANKSVIASMLEREPQLNAHAHWDVLDPFGAGEIVFGNGELFRTGSAAIAGTMSEQLAAGVRFLTAFGPAGTDFLRVLQGAQGTLGVVTWAAVTCERIPQVERAFFIASESLAALTPLLAWMHWRRLGNAAFLVNGQQLASLMKSDAAGIAALAERLPPWAVWLRIGHGGSEFPQEQFDCELEELQAQAAQWGLNVETALADMPADALGQVLQAEPKGLYQNRLLGAHRSVFCLQQLDRVEALVAAAHAVLERQGWSATQLAVYVQPRLQGRNAHVEFILPHAPADTARAGELADQMAHALQAAGGFFSRPYGSWAAMAYAKHLALQPYLRQTKELFDPDRILNPGRLCY